VNGLDSIKLDRVLHLEDERMLATLMRDHIFPDWGGEDRRGWFHATSIQRAIHMIEEQKNSFQIAIVDLNLDDSWGIATLEALRPCTVAPFVVCSAAVGDLEDVHARAKELGVYGVIDKTKTFTSDRLRPIILSAYLSWREERILLPIQKLNEDLLAAKGRREKRIALYGHGA
jgi:response regulator of citrate/malate metabolism